MVDGETITVTHTAGTYDSKDVLTATTVSATSGSLVDFTSVPGTGALLSNYTLPTTAFGPGLITRATLTATIVGTPTKVYDGTTNATLASANYSLNSVTRRDHHGDSTRGDV